MPIAVVTDSGSDFTLDEVRELGIDLVPVWVVIGQQRFRDLYEIDYKRFSELVERSTEPPTTQSPSPEQFAEVFARLTGEGKDVVTVLLSSKISKSYENATEAAKQFGGRVHTFDTRSVAGVERLLVIRALELAREGKTAAQIAQTLDPATTHSAAYFTGPNVGALGRTGRVAQSVVTLSDTLHVSVVLKMDEAGSIVASGQSRDQQQAYEIMVDSTLRALHRAETMRVCITHNGVLDIAREVADMIRKQMKSIGEIPIHEFTPTTGLHLGSGAVGVYAIA